MGNEQLVKRIDSLTTNLEQVLMAPYGQQGALLVYETNVTYDGPFYCIVALADDVKLNRTSTRVNWDVDGNGINSWNTTGPDFILPVGLPLYGDFATVHLTLVSGAPDVPKLLCYKK